MSIDTYSQILTTTYNGQSYVAGPSERMLTADAVINAAATVPGMSHAENNFTDVAGGFKQNGVEYTHLSPHLKGALPQGSHLGFKDGHVAWQKFDRALPRTGGYRPAFCW